MIEESARHVSQTIINDLFGPPAERSFQVQYWDGTVDAPGLDMRPAFTLVLCRPCALRRMLAPPTERALGEAFVRGDIDVAGDLEAASSLGHTIRSHLSSPVRFAGILARLRSLPAHSDRDAAFGNGFRPGRWSGKHSRQRDAEAVRFHYDAGNDFFGLFLDRRMMYSCAYFRLPTDDLDVAQEAKLEHICRKLNLQPGERLLDIGCGWGGLVEYAASRFGVEAVGITLSQLQADVARQRIAASGLGERRVVERNPCSSDGASLVDSLNGLDDADVVCIGSPLGPDAIRLLFGGSAAVLANSGREPFGLVGLEAMASGSVTCVGGTGEEYAVPGWNALVLQTEDPREFLTQFEPLLANPHEAEAMRRRAVATARRFVWREIVERNLLPRLRFVAQEQGG